MDFAKPQKALNVNSGLWAKILTWDLWNRRQYYYLKAKFCVPV
jgi:hypothetical protein